MKAKYLDPFTDFGFKRIFGQEASKPLLRDFLNALLPPTAQIRELSFKNTEQPGLGLTDRKAIGLRRPTVFDIYCESDTGEKFIVELQKAKQNYFKDRTVFYSTFPIREQAEAGTWNFALKAVYCVGILDFVFNDSAAGAAGEVVHEVKLKNQHGAVFYDKLTYYYLEMPNFHKTEAELTTRLDQWLFFLKHLEELQSIPQLFRDEVFTQAFDTAALAQMSADEWEQYEGSLKSYRDALNMVETAREEGEKLGVEKVARALKAAGVAVEVIAQSTGLTLDEIAALDGA